MKKLFTFFAGILISLLLADVAKCQQFSNGEIAVELSDYGRVRIFAPDELTYQIDRFSILVGNDAGGVFDYWNDAENVELPMNIEPATFGDYEIYVAIDNSYLNPPMPPNVKVLINVYGWSLGGYVLAKFRIINQEISVLNAKSGYELIPYIDGSYGFETVEFDDVNQLVKIFNGSSTNVGIKVFSHTFSSVRSFEWYSGYNNIEDSLYAWLNYGQFDLYTAGSEGSVSVSGFDPVDVLNPEDTATVYVGFAVGMDETEMLTNMSDCEAQYNLIATSVKQTNNLKPDKYSLSQNYPNPFNPSTSIDFSIIKSSHVILKVFNTLGQEVASPVNSNLPEGNYSINFNAANLPSGIYYYSLTTGSYKATKKMILVK